MIQGLCSIRQKYEGTYQMTAACETEARLARRKLVSCILTAVKVQWG